MPSLSWKVLAVVTLTGVAVVLVTWSLGPALIGDVSPQERRVVPATVVRPADCNKPGVDETVRFELNGNSRTATLSGCGHGQDEKVTVAVPADGDAGPVTVSLASTARGYSDLRRPVGLALMVLGAAGGATYAYLVVRGPRRHPALA